MQPGGAWAGTTFKIILEAIYKTVSQAKWDKGKLFIRSLVDKCKDPKAPPRLNHKDLESKSGFLVHLSRTFSNIVPFLKGLHLTIDLWRPLQNNDGWKFSHKEIWSWLEHQLGDGMAQEEIYKLLNVGAPSDVVPVEQFTQDLEFLSQFFESESPPRVLVRSQLVYVIKYGFGDASGKGFGSTFTVPSGIAYRIVVWEKDESNESSNWREFTKVVESLYEEATLGRLDNCLVYFFTDNTTAEASLFNGMLKSKKLLAQAGYQGVAS